MAKGPTEVSPFWVILDSQPETAYSLMMSSAIRRPSATKESYSSPVSRNSAIFVSIFSISSFFSIL